MSAHGDDKSAKFIGIIGHENVSHNGSKTTVYFLQVQVDNAMWVVRHRYHDFKDFYDKVRVCFGGGVSPERRGRGEEGERTIRIEELTLATCISLRSSRRTASSVLCCRPRSSWARSTRSSLKSASRSSPSGCICCAPGTRPPPASTRARPSTTRTSCSSTYVAWSRCRRSHANPH